MSKRIRAREILVNTQTVLNFGAFCWIHLNSDLKVASFESNYFWLLVILIVLHNRNAKLKTENKFDYFFCLYANSSKTVMVNGKRYQNVELVSGFKKHFAFLIPLTIYWSSCIDKNCLDLHLLEP